MSAPTLNKPEVPFALRLQQAVRELPRLSARDRAWLLYRAGVIRKDQMPEVTERLRAMSGR